MRLEERFEYSDIIIQVLDDDVSDRDLLRQIFRGTGDDLHRLDAFAELEGV